MSPLAAPVLGDAAEQERVGHLVAEGDAPTAGAGKATRPHAAFVISHGYVDALACFREPIKWLADRGWHVDLYTSISHHHSVPNFHRELVRLVPLSMSRAGALRLVGQLAFHSPRYQVIVTVPQWSLYYSVLAASVRGIPVVYLSDELRAAAEASSPTDRLWKRREMWAHRRCAFSIALDERRAEFLRADHGLSPEHPIYVVPNASPGPAQRVRSRYFQDALDLPDSSFVILHAGGLGWPPVRHLIEQAQSWPMEEGVYVFQTRLHAQLAGRQDRGPVRFSTTILPSDLLDYAVSSAHVGLALYPVVKKNDELMGRASGKVALYLKNGIPVIATDQAAFRWIVDDGCGVLIRDLSELRAAVREIREDYAAFAVRARSAFERRLDFRTFFPPVERALGASQR